tara:strand:- start:1573 stop:2220 length:648 start_codon:yes stop_codon:yes gene_type:complete
MRIVVLTLVFMFIQAVPSFAKCKKNDVCSMMEKMDHFSILNACPGSAPLLRECKKVNAVALPALPAPEFVDNGDGTITDKINKLRWQKKGTLKRLSLKDAKAFAGSESFAGSSNWRLPTLPELRTLLYPEKVVNASGKRAWINPIFDNSKAHYYWTSTKCDEVSFIEENYQGKNQKKTCQRGEAASWLVLFKVGTTVWFLTKEAKHHLWLVQESP